jgi:hypothetical protein
MTEKLNLKLKSNNLIFDDDNTIEYQIREISVNLDEKFDHLDLELDVDDLIDINRTKDIVFNNYSPNEDDTRQNIPYPINISINKNPIAIPFSLKIKSTYNPVYMFNYSFQNNKYLKSVDLSECTFVKDIGISTFEGCSTLELFKLPNKETYTNKERIIETDAFKDCTALKSVDLSINTERIDPSAFEGCTFLESVDLSGCSNVETIPKNAFRGCTSLKSVNLSNNKSLISVRGGAFEGCISLESVDLSNCESLRTIGDFGNISDFVNIRIVNIDKIYDQDSNNSPAFGNIPGTVDLSGCTNIKYIFDLDDNYGVINKSGRFKLKTEAGEALAEANIRTKVAEEALAEANIRTKVAEEALVEANIRTKVAEEALVEANIRTKVAEEALAEAKKNACCILS